MQELITIDHVPPPPSVIGWNYHGRIVGVGDLAKITWRGLLKTGIATGIATAATAVRGANVALAEIEYSRSQMAGHLAVMQAQRDAAVTRADIMLRAQAAIAEAKASRKVQRWSTAERDKLTRLRATGMTYPKIAAAMSDEFGRAFTASSVGAQARKLALATPAKSKAAKPASKARKSRKG
jgi:serine/threonine-protein kinase RIO1